MNAAHPFLTRRPARAQASLSLLADVPGLELAQARVHEACGPARHTLALWLAMQTAGVVLWIVPSWFPARLNCDGVRDWIDPARLVFVTPRRAEDLLWTMEEALRAGACALAVVELPALPTLTQVRRMQLAAESGTRDGPTPPTGLLLTPGDGGAPGVETRWHLASTHAANEQSWRLERRRARMAPPKTWALYKPAPDQAPCPKQPVTSA